jgi:hypothetical protein
MQLKKPSVASNQFPQIVWRNGEKKLWNPIHRKALKNRPEERVRLRILEYLICSGWSKHRISTEEMIGSVRKDDGKRTDLVCYTRGFEPWLLVECKAENIKLSAKTALQIAQYNRQVEAPYLLITNGRTDYWYSLEEENPMQPLSQIPEPLPSAIKFPPDYNYNDWKIRGFAGLEARPALRSWLQRTLQKNLLHTEPSSLQYLSFKHRPANLDLSHYYRAYKIENCRMALGFIATEYGGSRLIAILNIKEENAAVMEINLDLLADERAPNASIYWAGGKQNCDAGQFINQLLKTPFNGSKTAKAISTRLMEMID